jgi:Flp pilus assembly protein TadD
MTAILRTLTITSMTLMLAACAGGTHKVSTNKSPYDAKINAALERAADQAEAESDSAGSVALLERLYKRDPKDSVTAYKYARALRKTGDLQRAALVLAPFANMDGADADLLTEFATLNANLGKYQDAETFARKAIAKDDDSYKAYQILGIALDAQEKYPDAEAAFRQALDMWKGDPIPVMNNLALNLTNQERLSEALEIMERAKEAAPNRVEVERNLRIIRTLNESASGRPAPKPIEKPSAKPVKQP